MAAGRGWSPADPAGVARWAVVGQVARAPRRARRSARPGAPRWCAPSRRRRSSGPARSAGPAPGRAVTGPHCSDPGRTTDAVPTQVTSRPPLSLLRISTSTRAPSSRSGQRLLVAPGDQAEGVVRRATGVPDRACAPCGVAGAASRRRSSSPARRPARCRGRSGPGRRPCPRACQNRDPDNRCRAHPAPAGRRRRRGVAVRSADGGDGGPAAGDRVLAQRLRDGGALGRGPSAGARSCPGCAAGRWGWCVASGRPSRCTSAPG